MKHFLRAPLLALLLPGACARAPRPAAPVPAPGAISPTTALPGDSISLAHTIALAQAREWTVRVVTLTHDTLVGRASSPGPARLRIRLQEVPLAQVAQLERKEGGGGLYETRLMAGAAVGAMLGLVTGFAVAIRGDLETGSVRPWALAGAIVGVLVEAPRRPQSSKATWTPLWRRP